MIATHNTIAAADFSKSTLRKLAKLGIGILGKTLIPDMSSPMPYANGTTGYNINDNGTGRVLSFLDLLKLAQ